MVLLSIHSSWKGSHLTIQVEEDVLSAASPVQCGVWVHADQLKRKARFVKGEVTILIQYSMHVHTCACIAQNTYVANLHIKDSYVCPIQLLQLEVFTI